MESEPIDAAPLLADVLAPDARIVSLDLGAKPDSFIDSSDTGLTTTDLGMVADLGAGSEAAVPTGCAGQDLYFDVSDGQKAWRLVYSGDSAIPLATGKSYLVSISVSEKPDNGGANLIMEVSISGSESARSNRVVWTPAAGSKSMDRRCGGQHPVNIIHFEAGGGILEGDFDTLGLGYSCEGIEATLRGHFRVCYVPTE